MSAWVSANIWNIIICLILIAIVVGIVFTLKRDKKKGKSACGGSCCHCPMAGKCHEEHNEEK